MFCKIILYTVLMVALSSCEFSKYSKKSITGLETKLIDNNPKEEMPLVNGLKRYLIDKKIAVETVSELKEARGIYEVRRGQTIFYIDSHKNVFLGMVVNIETGKNITLSERRKENVLIEVSNGELFPFEMKNLNIHSVLPSQLPGFKTPADVDKIIQEMETNIERFKEIKNKMNANQE